MTEGGDPTPPRWARWITYGSLILALLALGWTIFSVGPETLLARLIGLGPWLFGIIGIDVLVTACDAATLHAFLRPEHRQVGYPRVVLAQVAGRATNVVTPLGHLGELVKITMLMERVRQPRAVAAVLLFNLVDLEISLLLIAIGAPLTGLLLELPGAMVVALLVTGAVAAVAAVALPVIVSRGMLVRLVDLVRRLRLIGDARHARWRERMAAVDEKLRDPGGARTRDRMVGVAWLLVSRALTWVTTGVLVHAAGGPVSVPFLAAIITLGQVITWVSGIVPLGLGLSEGGNFVLFKALGVDPAVGVSVALGRRVVPLIYAAIGLALASVNQTVKEVSRRPAVGRRSRPSARHAAHGARAPANAAAHRRP